MYARQESHLAYYALEGRCYLKNDQKYTVPSLQVRFAESNPWNALITTTISLVWTYNTSHWNICRKYAINLSAVTECVVTFKILFLPIALSSV